MQLSTSHHPTTFWQSARMWRAMDTSRQTFMCSLKNLKPTSVGHHRIVECFQEEEKEEKVKVSFHVGRSPTKFQKIVGQRYLHVLKCKPLFNHNFGGPLECGGPWTHAPRLPCIHYTIFNLQVPVTEDFEDQFQKEEVILTWRRRRLLGEPGFEKMRVVSWHIQTLPHQIPSSFGRVCPCSHQNMADGRPTWKLTLSRATSNMYIRQRVLKSTPIQNQHL